ncbi:hypothetical protein L210DRAFT_427920 [Boletus edulis BED1]|uniref:Uncharacterized protein n=1 Tax=Boletus edulis BED1 TaxID=1328754 RepID=A0AAD4BKA3_BOLED|nr:hypothetical protein L210DRAFT_427920 [Boletus edulis BED1]
MTLFVELVELARICIAAMCTLIETVGVYYDDEPNSTRTPSTPPCLPTTTMPTPLAMASQSHSSSVHIENAIQIDFSPWNLLQCIGQFVISLRIQTFECIANKLSAIDYTRTCAILDAAQSATWRPATESDGYPARSSNVLPVGIEDPSGRGLG